MSELFNKLDDIGKEKEQKQRKEKMFSAIAELLIEKQIDIEEPVYYGWFVSESTDFPKYTKQKLKQPIPA